MEALGVARGLVVVLVVAIAPGMFFDVGVNAAYTLHFLTEMNTSVGVMVMDDPETNTRDWAITWVVDDDGDGQSKSLG